MKDIYDKEWLQRHIPKEYNLLFFDQLDSTNTYLMEHANLPDKTVVLADHQTNGKGRNGRTFYSPSDAGIYCSILLKANTEDFFKWTAYIALCACTAIEDLYYLPCEIKWLNDIVYQKKKLAGILCEASFSQGRPSHIVLGIGINVHSFVHPNEITDIAGSIEDFTLIKKSRSEVVARFLNEFDKNLISDPNLVDSYRKRMAYKNQEILVIQGNQRYPAKILDIDSDYRLIIQTQEGIKALCSGEISIRSIDTF